MKIYLVGGAVRDQLLGIADENTEKDWVVVDSSPDEMLDLGYRQVGQSFPVFLHPGTQEEYALARVLSNPLSKSSCPLNGSTKSPFFVCAIALMVKSRRDKSCSRVTVMYSLFNLCIIPIF
jgi:hypothetical protein